eukprot:scaffold10507_cov128-Cylindrotheca_fusiformis.AAC.12
MGLFDSCPKVVSEVAGAHNHENSFELMGAFDNVLTADGYKEEATLSSISPTELYMSAPKRDIQRF